MRILFVFISIVNMSFLLRALRVPQISRLSFFSQIKTSPAMSSKAFSRLMMSTTPPPASSVSDVVPPINYFEVDSTNNKIEYGDYSMIASQEIVQRKFEKVKDLTAASGEKVWLRGRLSAVRAKGNACFLVLRGDSFYTVQCCHFKSKEQPDLSKQLIKFASSLTCETIVDVLGTVVAADVKSCSQSNVELQIEKLFVVSRAPAQLPFLLQDAARAQSEIDASQTSDRPFPNVPQDLRLSNRWLDLRVPANNAVMRIKSGVSHLFREALLAEDFVEIQSPKLIAGESEGGADVFRTDYFGQPACLAQSPQLYKQMAISSDLGRVFEVGPVFRAENSKTRRHLCEFTGLDLEMEVKSHYSEALLVIHKMFRHIFEGLEVRFARELAVIREQYPSQPVRFTDQPLVLHWPDALRMLEEAGMPLAPWDDLSSAAELRLGELVAERFGADFFMLDQYPSAVRPFYTMVNATDNRYSNSYDIFLRGQEICSGAQRCHIPVCLYVWCYFAIRCSFFTVI